MSAPDALARAGPVYLMVYVAEQSQQSDGISTPASSDTKDPRLKVIFVTVSFVRRK